MVWLHHDQFPYKQPIVMVGCCGSAIAAAFLPDLSPLQRLFTPLVSLFGFVVSYAFLRLFLALIGVVRPVAVAYAFFVFYGMLLCGTLSVLLLPFVVFDPDIGEPGERAYLVASAVPSALGACSAVLATFRRWQDAA